MKQYIDFDKAYEKQHGKKKRQQVSRKGFKLAVTVLLLCVAATGVTGVWLKYQQYGYMQECQAIEIFLNNSEDALKYERLWTIQEKYSSLQAYNDGVDTMADIIQKRPTFTQKVYGALQTHIMQGMSLLSMTYSPDGIVTAGFSCQSGGDAAAYVESVRNSGFFDGVSYNGWAEENGYSFQINCVLKGVA